MTQTKEEQFKKGFEQLDELLEKERAKNAELLEALKEVQDYLFTIDMKSSFNMRELDVWKTVEQAIKKAEGK